MPSFFSWQVETVLFFLAEKEKNGFKKAFLRARRKPEEAGGQGRPPLRVQCWNHIEGVSERREQSAALFRTVGMDATDG